MLKSVFLCILAAILCTAAIAQRFKVTFTAGSFNGPFSGKVLLYLSKDNHEPISGASGLAIVPCFLKEVRNISAGQSIVFDDEAVSFPAKLSDIERGTYFVQAVWDRNLGGRAITSSPGNIYSKAVQIRLTKNIADNFELSCNQVVPEKQFVETAIAKELRAPSKLLSDFHKRPVTVDAAVLLPAAYYKEPGRRFPVLFVVSGFGGDYHYFSKDSTTQATLDTIPAVWVYLDGNCPLGHSVYANSDNNGPWGDALIKEFIPLLESKYRTNGARLLTGHSSGGFTVLWLQTHYPQTFIACASSAPDPVDFRNFQKIDLYRDENLFYAKDSSLNNVATVAGKIPWFSFKHMYQMENVLYRGEQMRSFEAVFSKKESNGEPGRMCDVTTGVINKAVIENWKKYDLSLYLRTNWQTIRKDLEGKIRVSVGMQDNFLLNYAVQLLETEMKKLDAGFVFGYYPGDHFTVASKDYRKDRDSFLRQKYLSWLQDHPL